MDTRLVDRFRQAYRNLELFPLITAEQIEEFRIDYAEEIILRLEDAVENAQADGKLIFAGHRGCGKSTLLARFSKQMMRQGYFVVYFSIAEMVPELSAIDHVNILYAIALSMLRQASLSKVAVPETTATALREWFSTTHTQVSAEEIKGEFGVGLDFFKFFTAKLRKEPSFRDEVKTTYEKRVSELASKADEIASLIQTTTKKQVLMVIDDLDKLDLSLVESIYKNNIGSLCLPRFRIIYTIPISAIRNNEVLAELTSARLPIQFLSVAKFFKKLDSHKPDAVPKAAIVQRFLDILAKRIPADLIQPETSQKIVLHSGGVVRELVRLAQRCCGECTFKLRLEPDRTDLKIDDEILATALKDLRNEFARPLGSEQFALLQSVYEKFKPANAKSDDFLSLLHGLHVLEYENDDLWYDVHPIVVTLLQREGLI